MISSISCDYCGATYSVIYAFCQTCGRQLTLKQRYHLRNKLGAGGQGAVYHVEDIKLAHRVLAAKKLQPERAVSPQQIQEAIEAFQREAEMLASLKHPNLPAIYDYFEENSNYYLIMELIAGETLEERLETLGQQLLPLDEVLRIGIELATVLDYLHTRTPPIIFRDLKPANIMLTAAGHVYLIDFGIARHFKPGQSKDTTPLGSKGYAPPEQYKSTQNQTTSRSDIYSLGAIMHQLLTGDDPIDSPFNFSPLTGQSPELHQLLKSMVDKLMQQRPASAAEVKQKFLQIRQGLQQPTNPQAQTILLPTSTANVTTSKKTNVIQPGPPTILLASAASPQMRSQAPLPQKQGELHYTYTHASQTAWALAWSPDSLHLAIAGEEPDYVSVWQASTGKMMQTYKNHRRSVHALAWSPDSKHLASASNDSTVHIWDALTGYNRRVYQEHRHWVQTLAWSPSGMQLASGDANGSIHLWDAQTGQQQRVYRGHTAQVLALAFSPDGKLIASTDDSNQLSIQVWEALSGKLQTTYTGHKSTISALAWSPTGQQIVSSCWNRTDHTLHVWEVSTGQQSAHYAGHQRLVNALAWSPTSKLIASAGKDKTVHIWDPQTCQIHFIYRGHTTGVNLLAWSPTGTSIASAGDDATTHVWRAN
jgi:eukaryotic-like serine/threonine-protein kinase